jgi:hypothetical protein
MSREFISEFFLYSYRGLVTGQCETHTCEILKLENKDDDDVMCIYIKGCLLKSRDTCRTRGEGSLMWLLGSS